MPYGASSSIEKSQREQVVALAGLATDVSTAVASSGAATCHDMFGQITTEALSTAAAAEYTLTLTNNKINAGDMVFASVDRLSSTGSPAIGECTVTAGQVVITVTNLHASAAFNAALRINFMVVRPLSAAVAN